MHVAVLTEPDEVEVRGSYRYANTYPIVIELLAERRADTAGFVEFDAPLSDVHDAFERAADPVTVKGVIQP